MASGFGKLFNNLDLVDNAGNKVKASSLDGSEGVGLYFSAHWCPPCKMFTPVLVKMFNNLKKAGKNIPIVFLSSDKTPEAFKEYFAEMPWLALPFEHRRLKQKLSNKYKVQGIPTLVLLDGKGNLITTSGRAAATDESGAGLVTALSTKPRTVADMLGTKFLKGDEVITADTLKGKTVALYFSASWCGPCKKFSPELAKRYAQLEKAGKPFEVVLCSLDKSEGEFDAYRATMPWAALPYSERKAVEEIAQEFGVQSIPSLIVLKDLETCQVINETAIPAVAQDTDGSKFPWYPQPLNSLSSPEGINENCSVVALLDGNESPAESVAALKSVAEELYAAAHAEGEQHADYRFFYATSDTDGVAPQIRALTKVKGPTLLMLDLPGFHAQPLKGPLTAAAVKGLLEKFDAEDLEMQVIER